MKVVFIIAGILLALSLLVNVFAFFLEKRYKSKLLENQKSE